MPEDLSQIIARSERIVFFGGAGVSTESGIPDFRSAEGLYNQETTTTWSPEQVLSHSFFLDHPDEFFAYYTTHLVHLEARPNQAHRALASLEARGKLTAVVTQNIDGLHQAAGSREVIELHGSVLRNYCCGCGAEHTVQTVVAARGVPRCPACGGVIRPDVVLYEEPLDMDVMDAAVRAVASADTLIVGGTSLAVYPAAGLIDYFRGSTLVLINKDPTPADRLATLVIHASLGATLAPYL
ncbi:MAG: NAD-dependent protein deacylase [Propionibacteriaceae bacterium]|nr:NAD-dependent protein deacylase [Propionibacteriaceae bacterium]